MKLHINWLDVVGVASVVAVGLSLAMLVISS
jgi:hypothetical protein